MFRRILFAYNGSAESQEALFEGVALALGLKSECFLLAVVPSPPPLAYVAGPLPAELFEMERPRFNEILEDGLQRLHQAGLSATGILRSNELPVDAIVSVARETAADLVIIGHHRRSAIERWWRGSVGHSLVDQLPCSLLVSMPDPDHPGWTEPLVRAATTK